MTIIFHKYRPFHIGQIHITIWFITFMKRNALTLLENAVERYEKALGYHVDIKGIKF